MPTPSLRDLQSLFWASLNGQQEPALRAVVRSTPELGGEDRLAIYAEMYFARLRDVLAEDFEKTAAVLGPEAFTALTKTLFTSSRMPQSAVAAIAARNVHSGMVEWAKAR